MITGWTSKLCGGGGEVVSHSSPTTPQGLALAALIAIPYSYHSPDTYVDTNVKGTLNVVQAARDLGTFAAAALLVLVVGAIACWIPASRASRVDPAETLRLE